MTYSCLNMIQRASVINKLIDYFSILIEVSSTHSFFKILHESIILLLLRKETSHFLI